MSDSQNFDGLLRWRCIGPQRGGRVVAVAGSYHDRNTFYFGACAGGVWKTTDAGVYWRPVSDGYFTTASIGALAVAPSDSNVIYAGTGETTIRIDVSHGDGVYRSIDGGKTWANVGLADTRHIGLIVVHPRNPDRVYVAVLGHAWGRNRQLGVFRSEDGGGSWQHVLYKSDRAGSHDIARDPVNPQVLYAAVWQAQRHPHALVSGGEECGLGRVGGDGGEDDRRGRQPEAGCVMRSRYDLRRGGTLLLDVRWARGGSMCLWRRNGLGCRGGSRRAGAGARGRA